MATKSSVNNRRSSAHNNCGIGEDGFEQGNDCAKGGGGGSSGKGSSDDDLKSQIDELASMSTKKMSLPQLREHAARLKELRQEAGSRARRATEESRGRSAAMDREMEQISRVGSLKREIAAADRATARARRAMDEEDESGDAHARISRRERRAARNSSCDETITCIIGNAKGKVQKKTIAGQEYLVAPITLIVPGVLSGSQGSGFYSKTENGKNVRAWNHMPLLNGHPRPGEGSGRNADIMNERYLGYVMDVKNDKELTGKAYFSVTALNTVKGGSTIKRMLLNGEPIEVSTGLDLERLKQKGTHNGDSYDWIAKNYQPDHVAVLLDEKGACSTKDGCGINNADIENNCGIGPDGFEAGNDCAKGGGGGSGGKAASAASSIAAKELGIDSLEEQKSDSLDFHEVGVKSVSSALQAAYRQGGGGTIPPKLAARIAQDELNIDSLQEQGRDSLDFHEVHVVAVDTALRAAFAEGAKAKTSADSARTDRQERQLATRRRQAGRNTRNSANNKCDECGEEECNCESAEDDTTNSISNEEETMSKKMTKAQRAEVINSIVENGCDCYTEEDVDALNTYTDERLQKISEHLEEHVTNKELVTNGKGVDFGKVAARRLKNAMSDDEIEAEYKNRQAKKASAANEFPPKEEDEEKEEGDEDEEKKKVPAFMKKGKAKNAEATPEQTMNEWLKAAPPEARSTLNRMFQRDKKEREQLLETIVNHYVPDGDEDEAKSVYDVHNAMSIEHLEMLATRIKKDEVQNHEEEREARPSFTGRVPALNGRKQEAKKAGTPLGVPSIDQMFTVINGRKTSSFQN